jgi:hypothetical protein
MWTAVRYATQRFSAPRFLLHSVSANIGRALGLQFLLWVEGVVSE